MKGSALIKRFQDKNRQLKESAEFERFLDSHERIWQDHERAQQGRGMKGIRRPGAVVRPAITRDDIGGPNVVNQLRKSRNPEADLDGLIRSAERNGDNERAARLKVWHKYWLTFSLNVKLHSANLLTCYLSLVAHHYRIHTAP